MKGVEIIRVMPCFDAETHSITEVLNGFPILNVKVLQAKAGARVGGHEHAYAEAVYVESGRVHYDLKTGGRYPSTEHVDLIAGHVMIKGPHIWHEATFQEDSVIWDFSELPHVSSQFNNL